jgi:hypothetical protein
MTPEAVGRAVVVYQFEADDEEWEAWKETVPRSKALDQRIRELLKADREGRVLAPDHDGDEPAAEVYDAVDEAMPASGVVDRVAADWDDSDERLAQRRGAAEAALELARERGQLGRADAVDALLPEHDVAGQTEETWWRNNVRPVLKEVATFSPGAGAYVVED